MEIATLTREASEDGAEKTKIRVLPGNEVDDLIKVYNEKEDARKKEERVKEEKAKQEKAAAASKTT